MSTFKEKLLESVVFPNQNRVKIFTYTGKAINKDGATSGSSCMVSIINEDGKKITIKGEIDRVYGNDKSGGWYPKDNADVIVTKEDTNYIILAKAIGNIDDYNKQYELKGDFFTNMSSGISPGFIF